MITRIGKISFIINLIISLFICLLGLYYGVRLYYNLFTLSGSLMLLLLGSLLELISSQIILLLPLGLHILTCLLALPYGIISRNKPLKQGITNSSFKLYFIVGTVVTLLLALSGLAVIDQRMPTIDHIVILSLLPVCTVIANIVISALITNTISTWRNSKFASLIMAGVLLIPCACLVCASLVIISNSYEAEEYAYHEYEDVAHDAEEEYDGEYEEEEAMSYNDEFIGLDGEIEPAAEYFYSKMNLRDAEDGTYWQLHNWKYYGWKEDDGNSHEGDVVYYSNQEEDYPSHLLPDNQEKFDEAKVSFYKLYQFYNDNKTEAIPQLFSLYGSTFLSKISSFYYNKTAVKNLLTAVLLSHNDLYARNDTNEALKYIYKIMANPEKELPIDSTATVVGYWRTSEYYPYLQPYISKNVFNQLQYTSDDSMNQAIAVWAYSFWARRHNDGTDDLVYNVLMSIQNYYQEEE